MDKALGYLALAKKAGLAELGEEPVGAATRTGKAPLVIVASDASDHTWRRALSFVADTSQQCLRLPYTKDELGQAVGRTSLAIAALTDAALALALVSALPAGEKAAASAQVLRERVERAEQRKKEAKAHLRNRRIGKARHAAPKKQH